MVITVASGKGGTGKTTVAVNLSKAVETDHPLTFLDCDVEEPNAHFFLKPNFKKRTIVSLPVPKIDEKKCTQCGECAKICVFNALAVLEDSVLVFEELCHGCGSCHLLCPENAIKEINRRIGILEEGNSHQIRFFHGQLDIGQALSPPLIKAVKKHIPEAGGSVIIDAPPGTSCPAIESMKDSDVICLVTEPTPFGLHDLILAVKGAQKMGIPAGVVINKAGVGDGKVRSFCKAERIPVLLEIPLDRKIAELCSKGFTFIDSFPDLKKKFMALYEDLKSLAIQQHAPEESAAI
jgi:MinD superfamily P-loop ATPase